MFFLSVLKIAKNLFNIHLYYFWKFLLSTYIMLLLCDNPTEKGVHSLYWVGVCICAQSTLKVMIPV